jgi:phosphopantetheinyl transferase
MPLILFNTEPQKTIAVWKIEEEPEYFLQHFPPEIWAELQLEHYTFKHQKLEQLSSRLLLKNIIGIEAISMMRKTASGMPFIQNNNMQISISHTTKYSAVMVSEKRCGIDIESVHPRVKKVAGKYLHSSEIRLIDSNEDIRILTLLWSAKESIYKIYAKGMVNFKEHITISQIGYTTAESGYLSGKFSKNHEAFEVFLNFDFFDGHVLTYGMTDI